LTGSESAVVTRSHLKNISDENIKRQIWSIPYSDYSCLTVIHNLIMILQCWIKDRSYLTSSYITLLRRIWVLKAFEILKHSESSLALSHV
jgi:hypothetical protein